MSRPTIAETGWADFTIDHLRESLKAAEGTASDLAKLRMCDAVGCGRMFDCTDPRSKTSVFKGTEYNFCPACEMEAQAKADSE